eukprot:142311_1
MSLSIQELDAIWNKYNAEFNRTPTSHHQFMAFAKASGTPIKFLDARKYFEMRNDAESTAKQSTAKQSRDQREKFTRNAKNNKNKKRQKHRRNSSLPELSSSK